MDIDLANEKLDYSEADLSEIRSKLDFVMNEQNKIMDALDILRIHLNDILPEEDPKIYFNFN